MIYENAEDQEAEEEVRSVLEAKLSSYGILVKIYPTIKLYPADWIIELPNNRKIFAEFKRRTQPAIYYNRYGMSMPLKKYQNIRMLCQETGIAFAAFFLTTDYLFSFMTCTFQIPKTGVVKYKTSTKYDMLVEFPYSLLQRW